MYDHDFLSMMQLGLLICHLHSVDQVVEFFTQVLDFSLTEAAEGPDGVVAAFLSCSNKAHDIAFIRRPEPGKFHHAAFWLDLETDIKTDVKLRTNWSTVLLWNNENRYEIVDELQEWCQEHHVTRLADLTGGLQLE